MKFVKVRSIDGAIALGKGGDVVWASSQPDARFGLVASPTEGVKGHPIAVTLARRSTDNSLSVLSTFVAFEIERAEAFTGLLAALVKGARG